MTAVAEPHGCGGWCGVHVTICPCSVHRGRLAAPARVSCIINSASPWRGVLAAFSAYGQSVCQDKQRSESKRKKNFHRKSTSLSRYHTSISCHGDVLSEPTCICPGQGLELKNKYVLACVYSKLQWERSEGESIPRSTFSQTHSSASEPAAAQGVGGCTYSSSKATRLSGQLKQAQCLASSYKEPGPAGRVLFDG